MLLPVVACTPLTPALHTMASPIAGMRVTVSADLPLDAQAYLLERDGAAFRSFMCEEVRPKHCSPL